MGLWKVYDDSPSWREESRDLERKWAREEAARIASGAHYFCAIIATKDGNKLILNPNYIHDGGLNIIITASADDNWEEKDFYFPKSDIGKIYLQEKSKLYHHEWWEVKGSLEEIEAFADDFFYKVKFIEKAKADEIAYEEERQKWLERYREAKRFRDTKYFVIVKKDIPKEITKRDIVLTLHNQLVIVDEKNGELHFEIPKVSWETERMVKNYTRLPNKLDDYWEKRFPEMVKEDEEIIFYTIEGFGHYKFVQEKEFNG